MARSERTPDGIVDGVVVSAHVMSSPILMCAGRTSAEPPGLAILAAVVPARGFFWRTPPYTSVMANVSARVLAGVTVAVPSPVSLRLAAYM